MSLIATTVAKAKSIVTFSSTAASFFPPLILAISVAPVINSFNPIGSIELIISGPILSILSVKCLSRIEAPRATAPKHAKLVVV